MTKHWQNIGKQLAKNWQQNVKNSKHKPKNDNKMTKKYHKLQHNDKTIANN